MTPNINLLPPLDKQPTIPRWLYTVAGGIPLIIIGVMIYQYIGAKDDLENLNSQVQQLTIERDELQMQVNISSQQSNKGSSLEQTVEFVENVSYPVTPLIDETKNLLPDYSYLRNYVFSAENVVITVDFETMSSISEYVEWLTTSPYFTDPQLASISNFEVGSNGVTEEIASQKFIQVPRYTTNITLTINKSYLAQVSGGY